MKKSGDGRELSVRESVSAFAAELFGNTVEALHEKGQDLEDSRRRKQYEHIFNRELRKLLALHMPFFHGYRFSAVLCAMILGLQLISANTTYAGTEYYMKSLKDWIPLVFTVVLQLSVVLLSTVTFDNTKHERCRAAALSAAVIISISISYVGIVNGIIDPMQTNRDEQNTYSAAFYNIRASLLGDESRAATADQAITGLESTVQSIFGERTAIEETIEMLRSRAEETTETKEASTITSGRGAGATREQHSTTKTEYAVSEKERLAAENSIPKLNRGLENLENGEHTFDALPDLFRESLKDGAMSEDLRALDVKYRSFVDSGKECWQIVHGEALAIPYASIAEAFDKVMFYGEVSGLTAFEDQEDSGGDLAEEEAAGDDSILGAVFNFSDTTTEQYMERMEAVQAQATESYQAISRFLSGEELLSLKKAYDALMVAKDANFIAFSHLSPESPNFASAVIAMLLAILVDGWTMVLARLKNRSEASPLYARGSEDFFEEEVDLMETVFMSIHQNPSAGVSAEEGDFAGYCTAYLNSIVSVIYNYLDKFQISDCTVHQGYGAYAFAEEIDGSCFRPITSILMKFNYMVSLSEWEYLQLRREWGEAEPAGASRLSEHSQGRTVYLLRSKAEIYLRQNIAKSNLFHTMMREFENWEVQHE